eukprot:CAMPEP_0177227656 /NCGR_PEP_ID=MMETSP0367-20130122/40736_1 /TAXON_ID=447022 ORGANISM="Scrippsiella hangoei-like, Strain SHHI-4" /NCGR_SAMPLE_ID=MMETSP0367 /ASSEMBLY_ACC=CAM_ASM_000362 /LENGTH=55 /DNA_ID=CAMNT_0018677911 /DNA_START=293 /DNA_END=461 /DNA_ORIENTATION=-
MLRGALALLHLQSAIALSKLLSSSSLRLAKPVADEGPLTNPATDEGSSACSRSTS